MKAEGEYTTDAEHGHTRLRGRQRRAPARDRSAPREEPRPRRRRRGRGLAPRGERGRAVGEPSPRPTRTWWTRSAGRSAWSRRPTPRCAPRKSFCMTAISAAGNSSVTPRKAARSLGEVSLQASLQCTPLGLRSAGGCQGGRTREGAQRGWLATSSKLRHAAPEPDHEGDTR
jgi:hypothetical protein